MGRKLWVSLLAASLAAGLFAAAPAAADANIVIGGVDTGVPPSCARTGTGPTGQNARWSLVLPTYSTASEGNAATCAPLVFAFMELLARNEGADGTLGQQFRNALFSGRVNLAKPYEVFLNNIYLTVPVLASLHQTADGDGTGIGSCSLRPYLLLIHCKDDTNGRFLARDKDGNPIGWPGHYLYIELGGIMSQGGGTTWGGVFIENTDVGPLYPAMEGTLEHHEQVHSQQWAQYGWDFANRYANELVNQDGNALYNFWLYGRVSGIQVTGYCYNAFERAAGFQDGRYAFPDLDHSAVPLPFDGYLSGYGAIHYLTVGQNYPATPVNPANWTDALNARPPHPWCPATWK